MLCAAIAGVGSVWPLAGVGVPTFVTNTFTHTHVHVATLNSSCLAAPALQHHEHPKDPHPMYWQVPRYQLVAVAGWGHSMRAAFMDIDDFLVIPSGELVNTENSCLALQTTQTDMLHTLHWESSLPPGALVTVSGDPSSGSDAASAESDSTATSSSSHTTAAAVLRVPRFDAMVGSGGCSSAAECLQQHNSWYTQSGLTLAVSTCPVQQGGNRASRRPVVSPHEVVAMRVYSASPRGGKLAGPSSPPSCAYLLHITNMLGPAQPWGTVEEGVWQPSGGDGKLGQLRLTSGQLPKRQSLAKCQQQTQKQGGGSSGVGTAAAGAELEAVGVQ